MHGKLSETNANVFGKVLHIEPLELKDADLYTCFASSPLGFGKKSIVAVTYDFEMKVLSEKNNSIPYIVEIYKFGHQNLGSKLEMKCVSSKFSIIFKIFFNKLNFYYLSIFKFHF